MSVIYGVITKNGGSLPEDWAERMFDACEPWPRDRTSTENTGEAILCLLQRYNTPQSICAKNSSDNNSNYLLFDGRLDNRQQLAQQLEIELTDVTTDEELILAAFSKYHTQLGQHLIGDFVIAIYTKTTHQLFLLRDQLGVRPLFIAESQHYLAFASNKAALLSLPWVSDKLNEQWLADTLMLTDVDHLTTMHRDISAFPPAHWMLTKQNNSELQQYWQLDLQHRLPQQSDQEYIDEFKKLLFEAVSCRLRSYGDIASELSGGLDSTSIASIAAILLKEQTLHTYSHLLPPELIGEIFPFKDEGEYIEQLISQYNNINHNPVYSRNKGIVEALEYSNKIHSGLVRADLTRFGNELFTHLKSNNRRSILSGFGGDQLVTSYGNGWDAELISQWKFLRLWKEFSSYSKNYWQAFKRTAYSILNYLLNSIIKNRKYNVESWSVRFSKSGCNLAFVTQQGYPKRYWRNPTLKDKGTLKQREFEVINSPHVLYRLEDSAIGAASYGVDYRYPLLDIRLLQYTLALPSHLKITKGVKRNMIRQATINLLPNSIRLRHDKSRATVPTVRMRILNDLQRLNETVENVKIDDNVNQYINLKALAKFIKIANETTGQYTDFKQKSLFKVISLILWLKN